MSTDNKIETTNHKQTQKLTDKTYQVSLEIIKKRKPCKGNCGPHKEYAYTYFPNIISLRKEHKKINVMLTGSTPSTIGLYAIYLDGFMPLILPDPIAPVLSQSKEREIKYSKGETGSLGILAFDSSRKNKGELILIVCDPQVQNSPPPTGPGC
jgi:hypothetical protein